MRGSVIPELIDALVAHAESMVDATVSDGLPLEYGTGTYLCIGVDDWDAGANTDAGSSTKSWSTSSDRRQEETGSITAMAWAQDGSYESKTVRDQVFEVLNTIDAWLRAQVNSTSGPNLLGVPGLWDVRTGGVERFNQVMTEEGARAVLRFSISFQAVL